MFDHVLPLSLTIFARARMWLSWPYKKLQVKPFLYDVIRVYVTVNMRNQGIRIFPEIFSEYAYSLKWSGNTRIP